MKRLFSLLALSLALVACASFSDKTQGLKLGMTDMQVKSILGDDYRVTASKYSSDGQPMEVWEYFDKEYKQPCWVYFKDHKLVQWGSPDAIKSMPELQGVPMN